MLCDSSRAGRNRVPQKIAILVLAAVFAHFAGPRTLCRRNCLHRRSRRRYGEPKQRVLRSTSMITRRLSLPMRSVRWAS